MFTGIQIKYANPAQVPSQPHFVIQTKSILASNARVSQTLPSVHRRPPPERTGSQPPRSILLTARSDMMGHRAF